MTRPSPWVRLEGLRRSVAGGSDHAQPVPRYDPGLGAILGRYTPTAYHLFQRRRLQKQLPGDLRVRVNERVFVEPEDGKPRDIVPDVRVVEREVATSAVCDQATESRLPSR